MRNIQATQVFGSTAMTGTATCTGPTVSIPQMNMVSAQVTWTGTATGTLKLQGSNDNVNFDTIVTYSVTAAGTKLLVDEKAAYSYARVQYVNATNTGTLGSIYFSAKGNP